MPQHNSETIFNATDIIYNATGYKLAHIHGKKRGTGDTGHGIVEVPEPNNILHRHHSIRSPLQMVPLSEYRQPIAAALAVHQIPQAAWEVLFTEIPRALSVGHEYIAWFGYFYNTRANVTSLFSFTMDVGYFVPCGAIGYFSGIVLADTLHAIRLRARRTVTLQSRDCCCCLVALLPPPSFSLTTSSSE